ncbi:phytanoyl-CoA dioxygenase family protein [Aestuariivirga litoralis]|uniref:phytanoyl-CoA dioxygenase family protein n=1 Tax=Aestuariivirga litoralis TaxID=2650924 RepID=UPI0018C7DCA7|nr:phytanoyl-CoA dioxygenase family protein [Aestuariivirga litoralis]MBG1233037.1 phytanoyl-CoA dioxygenase [Aestuariivirga litoralis]
MKLSAEHIDQYRADGATVVRGAFSPAQMKLLEQGITRNMAEPSALAIVASRPEDPGYFIEDFCNWRRIDEYKRFVEESPAAAIAAQLMGAQQTRLYHDHLLVKEPKTTAKTPWHQDQPYYNIDGFQNVSMWLPVDPVAEASTLKFVAGSHKGGWLMPRTFMNNEAKWFPEGTLKELPDIDGNPDQFKILAWALEPGDAVFFHMLTLHGAGGVASGSRRRVLSVRFIGDDVTHAPRKWRTSPPFPGLEQRLPAGAAMTTEEFPILWSAS